MTKGSDSQIVIEVLKKNSPLFQLKSGTGRLKSSEDFFSKFARRTDEYERASHSVSLEVLEYISRKRPNISLETGAGWSTCVFAACSDKHVCINPDITSNEIIQRFLRKYKINTGELIFLNETSDSALPKLDKSYKIDVALIDGNHSFPIPVIDWYYIDLHLKKDGIVIVDDSHIRSVAVLCDYLSKEKGYKKLANIGNAIVFRKNVEERVLGWADQPYNKIEYKNRNHYAVSITKKIMNCLSRWL